MKYSIIISVIFSVLITILLFILVYLVVDYACQTPFQSLVVIIGFMVIVLLMNIESKIDKLLNKK